MGVLRRSIAVEYLLITLAGAGLFGCFGALGLDLAERSARSSRRMARPRKLAVPYE